MVVDAVLAGGRVVFGGKMDAATRFIEPTIMADVPDSAKIWAEEIFGPILPIRVFSKIGEAIDFMNSLEKPLAQYIFSKKSAVVEQILAETSAGGVTVNDCGLHFYNANLPFGGVNNSGIGSGHGHFGFKAFSHERAVLTGGWLRTEKFFAPPFTEKRFAFIRRIVNSLRLPML